MVGGFRRVALRLVMKQLCERQQRSGGQCYGEFGIGDMKLAGSHATELIVSAHEEDANLYL